MPIGLGTATLLAPLVGGAFSAFGQHAANKQNLKIAREANQFNREERQAQNAWNLEQWHRMNAYNTPLAQRQRFEEAGLNPALMMGQFTPGTAQGVTGATPATAQTATMQNSMMGLAEGVNQGINSYLQSKQVESSIDLATANKRKLEADAHREEIKNLNLPERERAELDRIYAETTKVDADINRAVFDLELARKLAPHQVEEYVERVKSVVTDTELKQVQVDLAKYQLKHVEPAKLKELYANMASAYAHIKYLNIQGNMTEKQIEKMTTEIGVMESQKLGIDANTEQVKQLTEPMRLQLIMQAKHFNSSAKYVDAKRENISFENGMMLWQNANGTMNTVIKGVSAFATGGFSMLGSN